MKKILLIISVITLFSGCKKDFSVWRNYNEDKLKEFEANLGADSRVVDKWKSSSGLLVEVFHKSPSGIMPKLLSQVCCTYYGYLADGTLFDSYVYKPDEENYYLTVEQTVEGWQEILCQMPMGSHFRIYVPYELGYGKDGSKGTTFIIPPYSTLIFDIEINQVLQNTPN